MVEPLGKPPHEAVAQGVLGGGRHGDLDVGLIADGLLTRLLRHALLDQRPPFRSRPTRLRWVALPAAPGDGPSIERFTLAEDELRTVRAPRVPDGTTGADLAALCDDLALHDWLLTTVVRMLDGVRLGGSAAQDATAVVRALRPAVDHLLHLWMPRARVTANWPRCGTRWRSGPASAGSGRPWCSASATSSPSRPFPAPTGRWNRCPDRAPAPPAHIPAPRSDAYPNGGEAR